MNAVSVPNKLAPESMYHLREGFSIQNKLSLHSPEQTVNNRNMTWGVFSTEVTGHRGKLLSVRSDSKHPNLPIIKTWKTST